METYKTAKVALQDKQGDFLLLRRSSTHPSEALKMDLPGGVIDEGEQPEQALAREILEETGLGIAADRLILFYANVEEFHHKNAVRLVYLAKLEEAKPAIKISWEHDSYEWLSLSKAIEALPEERYTHKALQHLKDKDLKFL